MIEFLTVSSVNADNRKRDVFPGSRGQSVRGAKAHEPWGHYFYSSTLNLGRKFKTKFFHRTYYRLRIFASSLPCNPS